MKWRSTKNIHATPLWLTGTFLKVTTHGCSIGRYCSVPLSFSQQLDKFISSGVSLAIHEIRVGEAKLESELLCFHTKAYRKLN